jgi:hypothetical protein
MPRKCVAAAAPAKDKTAAPAPQARKSARKPARAAARSPRPQDNPIQSLTVEQRPPYDYTFDVLGLIDDADRGPDPRVAVQQLVAKVQERLDPAAKKQIVGFDPTWALALAQVLMTIVTNCPRKKVEAALALQRKHPDGIRALHIRLALASRLPGHWKEGALPMARTILDVGAEGMDTELFPTLFPPEREQAPVAPCAALPDEAPPAPDVPASFPAIKPGPVTWEGRGAPGS